MDDVSPVWSQRQFSTDDFSPELASGQNRFDRILGDLHYLAAFG